MHKKQFEELVKEGIKAIPEKFLRKLDNVGIVVEDRPTTRHKKKLKLCPGMTLFGLYEGIPKTKRDSGYSGVLPDKITIFMEPILQTARSEEEVKEIVRDTVRHEIAHHFGLDEMGARKSEKRKKTATKR